MVIDMDTKILNLIDTVVGIILLCIAIKGVDLFKERRHSAVWDFYTNLETYLDRLLMELDSDAVKYLFETTSPTASKDIIEVERFRNLAKDFLNFLSTKTGQVPTIDDFDEWYERRLELIKFLNMMCYAGIRVDIVDESASAEEKRIARVETINKIRAIIESFKIEFENIRRDFFKKASS